MIWWPIIPFVIAIVVAVVGFTTAQQMRRVQEEALAKKNERIAEYKRSVGDDEVEVEADAETFVEPEVKQSTSSRVKTPTSPSVNASTSSSASSFIKHPGKFPLKPRKSSLIATEKYTLDPQFQSGFMKQTRGFTH